MLAEKFNVILVGVDPKYKTKLVHDLSKPAPYPNLTRHEIAVVFATMPSKVGHCLDLKQAVLLELLIELAGGNVDIRPAKNCD